MSLIEHWKVNIHIKPNPIVTFTLIMERKHGT